MISDYLSIEGRRCYIGDTVGSICNVVCVETYGHSQAIDVAESLKKLLDANGFTLHRIGYPAHTVFGREVIQAEYGIVIKGVRMEEIMKWQQA